jgi:cholesterol transport system auxiliary component
MMRCQIMRRDVLGGLVLTALGAAGCSVLPSQSYLQRRDWPLAVSRPQALPPRQGGRILLVRTVQAGPGLEGRGLSTLEQDGSERTAFYEQWAVPPAQAVDDDLRRWLAASGLFSGVVAPGSRLQADLVLEGELTVLHADLGNGTARAALALVLIDQHPTPARVLLQRTETASVKLEGKDTPAQVHAQVAAVEAVLRQADADIAAAIGPGVGQ